MPLQYFFLAAADVSGSIDRSTPLSDRLALGGEVAALGLGTVFLVLLILWGVLVLFELFFHTLPNRSKAKIEQKEAEILDDPGNTEEYTEPTASDDGELVAAITAAVSAYLDAETENANQIAVQGGFRVVSFRKVRK